MNLSATRSDELIGCIAAGCDRLVHSSVRGTDKLPLHRRLIGILLASPFLLSAIVAILFPPQFGAALTLAVVCAIFGVSWFLAVLVAVRGRSGVSQAAALALGAVAVSAIIAAAGGPASPTLLIALALPFEAWWLKRTPRAAGWGGAAAGLALAMQAVLADLLFTDAAPATGWHWLAPLAYFACAAPRLLEWVREPQSEMAGGGRAFEDVIEAVVLSMKSNGDVADVSAKARCVMGIPPELLLFSGLFERVHVADRVAYLCAIADMRAGAEARRLELRLRVPAPAGEHKPDNYRHFSVEFAAGVDDARMFTAIIRANDEVAELRAALAASADAAASHEIAKSRFLAAVSHELRTPLNAIIGFSDMLLHEMFGGFKDPRQKEYVGLVRDSGHHLLAVVNSILDVSRIESGAYATNPESFRFADAVDMCRQMMALHAGSKQIELTARLASDVGVVRADQRAVQQILINLVSNAIKFTPDGGRVMIGGKTVGSRLHFWVSDNGIGIAPDDLSKLGKPFVQVQNDYTRGFEGAGLGLSLVKGLVILHEGTMSIESEPGGGTTVTISLPVDGPAGNSASEPAEVVVMPASRSKEDNDGTLRKTA